MSVRKKDIEQEDKFRNYLPKEYSLEEAPKDGFLVVPISFNGFFGGLRTGQPRTKPWNTVRTGKNPTQLICRRV